MARIDLTKIAPAALKAVYGVEDYVRKSELERPRGMSRERGRRRSHGVPLSTLRGDSTGDISLVLIKRSELPSA